MCPFATGRFHPFARLKRGAHRELSLRLRHLGTSGNFSGTRLIVITALNRFARLASARSEVVGASLIILMITMMVVPISPAMLDVLLALNISAAILLVISAVLIESPLAFSSFPATRVTTPRQYAILSKLNQLTTLIKAQSLHKQFINCCEKAKIKSLPKATDLIDACLQITVSNDMFSGVSALMRAASSVKGVRAGSANMFLTNYNRQVLQSELLRGLYKNNFHRKQVVDHLDKSMRTGGIFLFPKSCPALRISQFNSSIATSVL